MDKRFLNKDSIFIVCLFLTVFVVGLYFCCQKSGLFVDEVITIGQANSDKGGWINEVREEYVDGNMIGHIITGKEIFDYMTVDVDEQFDIYSTYNNLSTDIHPPLYHILLKIFYSFKPSTFSYWPGLILNLIIYSVSNFVLFKICCSVFNSESIASLTMFLYAISPSTLSSLVFIRMYILLSLFTMLYLYEVILVLKKHRIVTYPLITVTVLCGMLTQYYFVFPAFFLSLSTLIILIKRKEIKVALFFSASAILGVGLLFVVFPLFLIQMGVRSFNNSTIVSGVTMNATSLSFRSCLSIMTNNIQLMLSDSLPAVEIIILLTFVCIVSIVVLFYRKSNGDTKVKLIAPKHKNTVLLLVMDGFTLIASFVVISLTTNFSIQRYFYNIQLFIYLFVCLLFCLASYYIQQIRKSDPAVFISVSMVAVIGVSIVTLNNRPLPYLFPNYQNYVRIVSDKEHSPCLYVSAGKSKTISSAALQFMIGLDDVYVTHEKHLDINEIKSYISNHSEKETVLVHIYWMEDKEKDVIDYLVDSLGYSESKLLFRYDSDRDACYVLE